MNSSLDTEKKISVIVPCFNEENNLDKFLKRLSHSLNEIKLDYNIIFIDDGSSDNTWGKISSFANNNDKITSIKLSRNFGQEYALKVGIDNANGDYIFSLDADLQDPPENILKMYERWTNGYKFVACIRKNRDDGLIKIITAKLFYILVRKFIIKNYPKNGYDMALVDFSLLKYLLNGSKSIHFPMQLYWLGYKPEIFYYERLKRKSGRSRWTPYKMISTALDVILGFSPKIIQLLSIAGICISFLSFIYGIIIIISALLGNIPVPGYASIVVFNSFFFGIIIFYISIVQEYLWRIFVDLSKTSEVIVDEIFY